MCSSVKLPHPLPAFTISKHESARDVRRCLKYAEIKKIYECVHLSHSSTTVVMIFPSVNLGQSEL